MSTDHAQVCVDPSLCTRIIAEYLEMPGLSVTMPQACRLWNVPQPTCARLLDVLLSSGFLRKSGNSYVRAVEGRCAA